MNLSKAFDEAGKFEFDGFTFENPNFEMLVFDENNFLEHLRVQSAGLAYYGALSKEADRNLENAERKYKIRYNEMYSECSDILMRTGKKNQVRDIEALVRCKYEVELQQWESKIEELQKLKDGINTFYEAWKSKGFSLSAMTNMVTSGLLSPNTSISSDDVENKTLQRHMNLNKASHILSK